MRFYSSDFVTYLKVLFEYTIIGDSLVPETIRQCLKHMNENEIAPIRLDKESLNKVIDYSLSLLQKNQSLDIEQLLGELTQDGHKLTPAEKEVYLKSYNQWCQDCQSQNGETGLVKAKKVTDIINRTQLQTDLPLPVQLKQFWDNINLINSEDVPLSHNQNPERIGLIMIYPEDVKIVSNATAWQNTRICFYFNPSQEPWENHAGSFAHEYTHILVGWNIYDKTMAFMQLPEAEKKNTSNQFYQFLNSLPQIAFEFPRFVDEIFAYCSGAIVQKEYFKSKSLSFVPEKEIFSGDRFVGIQTTLAARAIYPLYEEYIVQGKAVDDIFWKRATDLMKCHADVQKLKRLSGQLNQLASDEILAWNHQGLLLLNNSRFQDENGVLTSEFWQKVNGFIPRAKDRSKTLSPDYSR